MKKFFLSVFISFLAISATAQNPDYKISDLEGNEYENNSVHIFNVHGTFSDPMDEAKLHLFITNTKSNDIFIRAEIVQMVNTDGTLAQFCIGGPSGNCFNPITTGMYYPSAEGGVMYANSNWGLFDYVINLDSTNLSEYKVRFVQTDGAGNEIAGTDFFLTYLYDKDAMGVQDIQSQAIAEVYPTVVKGFTNVILKESSNVQLMNLEGRVVKTIHLNKGHSQIDLNGMAAGVYWLRFKGASGVTTNIKVLVK